MRQHCICQLFLLFRQGILNIGTHLVCQLTHCRALFGRKLAHLLEDAGQFTFFAQILHTQCLQQLGICTIRKCLLGSGTDRFQLFFHNIVPFLRFPAVIWLYGTLHKKSPVLRKQDKANACSNHPFSKSRHSSVLNANATSKPNSGKMFALQVHFSGFSPATRKGTSAYSAGRVLSAPRSLYRRLLFGGDGIPTAISAFFLSCGRLSLCLLASSLCFQITLYLLLQKKSSPFENFFLNFFAAYAIIEIG